MTAPEPIRGEAKAGPAPKVVRLGSTLLALAIAGAVLACAFLERPQPEPRTASVLPARVDVAIPPEDRARITGWDKFFACYHLASSYDVVIRTLREAHYAPDAVWDASKPVRVVLRPPPMKATPEEAKVLNSAVRLDQRMRDAEAREGAPSPCGPAAER